MYSSITAHFLGNEASKTTSYPRPLPPAVNGNETRYSLRVTTLTCKTWSIYLGELLFLPHN